MPRKSLKDEKKGGSRTETLEIPVFKRWVEMLSLPLEKDGLKAGGNQEVLVS